MAYKAGVVGGSKEIWHEITHACIYIEESKKG